MNVLFPCLQKFYVVLLGFGWQNMDTCTGTETVSKYLNVQSLQVIMRRKYEQDGQENT